MKKAWFDQRAVDGREWAVVEAIVTDRSSPIAILRRKVFIHYYACQISNAHRRKVIGRNMSKKEAEAMAKMLNAVKH